MIDRYLLRYFLAVIDEGNFSRAAAACNVSQPTLSVGIAKLERDLGAPLFLRSNRRVELTESGARLAPHARRIEAEFALAERSAQTSGHRTTVRLGVLASLPGAWIEEFLRRLAATDSHERVEIVEGRERDLLEALSRGRVDAGLTTLRGARERFASELLFSEGYALAVSAAHPLAQRDLIEVAELAGQPMIVRQHCELLSETSRHFTARGVRPFFPARTRSDERALAYVRAGLGVTVMPDCFAAAGVTRPRLADFDYRRDIGVLFAPHSDPQSVRNGPVLSILIAAVSEARPA